MGFSLWSVWSHRCDAVCRMEMVWLTDPGSKWPTQLMTCCCPQTHLLDWMSLNPRDIISDHDQPAVQATIFDTSGKNLWVFCCSPVKQESQKIPDRVWQTKYDTYFVLNIFYCLPTSLTLSTGSQMYDTSGKALGYFVFFKSKRVTFLYIEYH